MGRTSDGEISHLRCAGGRIECRCLIVHVVQTDLHDINLDLVVDIGRFLQQFHLKLSLGHCMFQIQSHALSASAAIGDGGVGTHGILLGRFVVERTFIGTVFIVPCLENRVDGYIGPIHRTGGGGGVVGVGEGIGPVGAVLGQCERRVGDSRPVDGSECASGRHVECREVVGHDLCSCLLVHNYREVHSFQIVDHLCAGFQFVVRAGCKGQRCGCHCQVSCCFHCHIHL